MPTDHAIFWAEVERNERVASDEIIRVWVRIKQTAQATKDGNTYNAGEIVNFRSTRAQLWELVEQGHIEQPWPERKK